MSAVTPGNAEFPSTQWSLIAAAATRRNEQSEAALAELCQQYWYPVYAFIRRRGASADDAGERLGGLALASRLGGRLLVLVVVGGLGLGP